MLSQDDQRPLPCVDKERRGRRRHKPRLSECEDYWDVPRATCIRCREVARCERAHVIDWARGGLDEVQNMVPLCVRCHKEMPPFQPGDEDQALAWLAEPDRYEWINRRVAALREQYPQEWADAEKEDTLEAAERVALLPLDYASFPRVTKAEV